MFGAQAKWSISVLDGISHELIDRRSRRGRATLGRESVFALGLALDVLLIVTTSVLTGAMYHYSVYGATGPTVQFLVFGLLVAVLFEMPLVVHSHYRSEQQLAGRRGIVRIANAWTYAFLCMAFVVLMTKTGGTLSRGWLVVFYGFGLVLVLVFEFGMRQGLDAAARHGFGVTRRVAVVGSQEDIARFVAEQAAARTDIQIAETATLPAAPGSSAIFSGKLADLLAPVVAAVRNQNISDVVILTDWPRGVDAMEIADTFLDSPVAVHLGQVGVVEHFPTMRVARLGNATTLVLRAEPLSMVQRFAKRLFDIVASMIALVLLAPVFLAVAALIKWDGRGPVFFRQRRLGFNQREFRIWKFRTMTTMDDGDTIVQASRLDPRVTRIGAFLRRFNIDELPQLVNVLTGQMALVGPRPHAVAHDRHYEGVISRYARRLNVKPGITGWAQIHGFRGEIEQNSAMEARVAHDIHYIENWSIALDLYIVLMTVLSRKAYRNAH